MIQGIQITKADNADLMNSFWLLDTDKNEARCVCAKAGYAEDQIVAVSELGKLNIAKYLWTSNQLYVWKAVSI